ncbi:MAG: hypothetical protein JWR44_3787 [Hymenobacter sp.]|jgi:hypothetical protein|nr:hypothetical protein [Hymenobacter sp.]
MKNLSFTLPALMVGLLALATIGHAQTFANSNFEGWTTVAAVEKPTNWLTTDDFLGGLFPTSTVTKTTVAHSGTYAVQMQTQTLLGAALFPGIIILGSALQGGSIVPGGLPFTARPRNLQCYYQLSGTQAIADSAAIFVVLTRHVGTASQIVAVGEYVFNALATSYTLATVPLQYASSLAPDSLKLIVFSGNATTVTTGTTLRLDDLAFTGTASATRNPALDAALSVWPNPSLDGHFTLTTTEPLLLAASLLVLDAAGRVVHREAAPAAAGTGPRLLDLSRLAPGQYTALLLTPQGAVFRRLSR